MKTDDIQAWQLAYQLLSDLLTRIEEVECGILTELGCPTALAVVYAILAGEQKHRWPTRLAARDKHRARDAMHTLALVAQTRASLRTGDAHFCRVIHTALLVGLHANDAALNASVRASAKRKVQSGGQKAGAIRADKSKSDDPAIQRHYKRWVMSDELQDEYRSPVTYITECTKILPRTLQRRAKRLGLDLKSRQ